MYVPRWVNPTDLVTDGIKSLRNTALASFLSVSSRVNSIWSLHGSGLGRFQQYSPFFGCSSAGVTDDTRLGNLEQHKSYLMICLFFTIRLGTWDLPSDANPGSDPTTSKMHSSWILNMHLYRRSLQKGQFREAMFYFFTGSAVFWCFNEQCET